MEPDEEGGPEADDDLLQKLRRMREQFGHEPNLLKHLDTTVDALSKLDLEKGDADEEGGTDE